MILRSKPLLPGGTRHESAQIVFGGRRALRHDPVELGWPMLTLGRRHKYTQRYAKAQEHLSIREVEQAIAKLLHDVTVAQDKAGEAGAAHQQAEKEERHTAKARAIGRCAVKEPALIPFVEGSPFIVPDVESVTMYDTGSFPGVHFLFRRNSDGSFAEAEVLRDKHGAIQFGYPKRHRYNSTVFADDWDQDGDLDLLLGYYNFSLVPNERSRRKPAWGDAVPLEINGQRIPGGIVPPCAADWDGDGRDDLIIGRGNDIVWYRNVGEKGRPVLATPEVLVPDNHGSALGEGPVGDTPRFSHAVNVVDYNGDGRLDLLVGDTYLAENELPAATSEQSTKDAETARVRNDAWSEMSRLTGSRRQGETVQEHAECWRRLLQT